MSELTSLSSQQIRCPYCGAIADRYLLDISQFSEQIIQRCTADRFVTRTVCNHCDYLMVLCTKSDAVVETYMAGF
ncbi:pyruvate-formate lyase-activating enzyme [Leptolyngbya sp. Heron Island J]|uniref:hypothetical protein n=1 Tax=Leptolyngbya sp. Heron Island J TaxID=1385935 RepID=UPI0003B9C2FC|nr:hypothetical protein [Leptolyngbya sp. Heron Island J]ESA34918.1 pyruvate-formate lyase-activating enzyme [Leptolyngbya sp. Heron Island J]